MKVAPSCLKTHPVRRVGEKGRRQTLVPISGTRSTLEQRFYKKRAVLGIRFSLIQLRSSGNSVGSYGSVPFIGCTFDSFGEQ